MLTVVGLVVAVTAVLVRREGAGVASSGTADSHVVRGPLDETLKALTDAWAWAVGKSEDPALSIKFV